MTRTEVDRFRAALTAMICELERITHHRDAITIERSADQLEEIQAASQRASRLVTSTVNLTNFETPLRRSVVPKKAASGYARSVMTRSP